MFGLNLPQVSGSVSMKTSPIKSDSVYAPRIARGCLLSCISALALGSPAVAQSVAPTCTECDATEGAESGGGLRVYEARYAPRAVALIARRVAAPPPDLDRLWYLTALNEGLGVLSWNAQGEIVGTRFSTASGAPTETPRGFVWLPQEAYGLAANQAHDLYSIAHLGDVTTPSFAFDVSDDGLAVGAAGNLAEADGVKAHAWDLSSSSSVAPPPSARFELHLESSVAPWSMALAVTPFSSVYATTRVVGLAGAACHGWREPYEFYLSTPMTAQMIGHSEAPSAEFHQPTMSRRKWACDVAGDGFDPIGSYDHPWVPNPVDECNSECGQCSDYCVSTKHVGTQFGDGSPLGTVFYRIGPGLPPASQATQVTSLRSITARNSGGPGFPAILSGYVGSGQGLQSDCPQVAALWNYGAAGAVRDLLPSQRGLVVAVHPLAQRWRSIDCICAGEIAVGWSANVAAPVGYFWTKLRNPSAEEEFELHSAQELLFVAEEDSAQDISIEQMYDIMPTGEILALVRRDLGFGNYNLFAAVLAVAGDIDGDRVVDAGDLALLMNSWGTVLLGDEQALRCDLDLDLAIGAADLAALLNRWDPNPIRLLLPADAAGQRFYCTLMPDEVCSGTAVDFSIDSSMLEDCLCCALAVVGFPSSQSFLEWSRDTDAESLEMTCTTIRTVMQHTGGPADE